MPQRVLFVCLGNICRSPMAEGAFRAHAPDIAADSAGTGDWHVGAPPDPRAVAEAARRGVDISGLRARQAQAEDFRRFDLILAMDRRNLAALERLRPADAQATLRKLRDFVDGADVPDPYGGGAEAFRQVWELIEEAVTRIPSFLRDARARS